MRPVNILLLPVLLASLALPAVAGNESEVERKKLEDWAKSLDKASIHKAVLDHEHAPLAPDAKKIRPVLAVHFEAVDYVLCLDQIGALLDSKNEAHEAVFWQVVFGSGDFIEQHPEQAKDKFTYMMAGLESGLRAYEILLHEKSDTRLELLDN